MVHLRALSALSLSLPFLPSALADVHEIWWDITYVQDINPDGLQPRRVIGVNNTWPYVLFRSAQRL
jgi:iron transport multicopper oxidase